MPLSRGTISVSDAGAVTATGLTKRLYDLLAATVGGLTPGGLVEGADGKPVKDALATTAGDWAEWLTPPVYDLGTVSGDVAIDWDNGWTQKFTLSGNVNLSMSHIPDAGMLTLIIKQSAGGGNTVTWPGTSKFSGADGTISVVAGAFDLYVGHAETGDIYWSTPTRNLV